jgi:hypothetical protein
MAKQKLPLYYKKYRWMIDVTEKPHHPEYPRYGAKGISCYWTNGEYQDFEHWLVSTLGHQPTPKHQLARKDKKGNFEPKNFAWMLPKQRSNTNTAQNILVTYKRETMTISQWADRMGIPYWTLRRRIVAGKSIAEIAKEFPSV